MIALGATAARALLGRTIGITSLRGTWMTRADGLRVLIAGHPSALLRMDHCDFDAAFAAWINDLRQAAPFGETSVRPTTGAQPDQTGSF